MMPSSPSCTWGGLNSAPRSWGALVSEVGSLGSFLGVSGPGECPLLLFDCAFDDAPGPGLAGCMVRCARDGWGDCFGGVAGGCTGCCAASCSTAGFGTALGELAVIGCESSSRRRWARAAGDNGAPAGDDETCAFVSEEGVLLSGRGKRVPVSSGWRSCTF